MFLKGLPSLGKSTRISDKPVAMQHTNKHPYRVALWALLLVSSTLGFSDSLHASSKSKPIEILSDPFGYGVPTHYTVLRGHTKATFSHPIFGQFTRAEIVQREKNGYRTTRFALSPDGKTFQPVMIQFRGFETYGYPKEDEHCIDPSLAANPLSTVRALGPAVQDGELIAKRRDELAKARFFDASCFDPSVPEAHRNAIFNAAADVLTPDLQEKDEFPKYLRCLERNGLAHESGVIQGYIQQALKDTAMAPKLKLSCTADQKAKPGQYNEKTRAMSLRLTPKPDRETYAQKMFHELLHTVPIRDGLPLELIEECCSLGEQCGELKTAAKKRKDSERIQSIVSLTTPAGQAAVASSNLLAGSELSRSFDEPESTISCKDIGKTVCASTVGTTDLYLANQSQCFLPGSTSAKLFTLIPMAYAATLNCDLPDKNEGPQGDLLDAIRRTQARDGQATLAEVARQTPVTSPISWDLPAETQQPAVPLGRMASNSGASGSRETPASRPSGSGRTIASIAPLPEPTTSKSMGSSRGRRDVTQTNRATVLVDTLERAANSVTKQLTFEKLDARKVEPSEVFRSASTANDKSMFVVASLADKPFQISNVADVKGLTFPNPFASANSGSGKLIAQAASAEASEQTKIADQNGQQPSETKPSGRSNFTNLGADNPLSESIQSGKLKVVKTADGSVRFVKTDRSPNKTDAPDFETMSHTDLKKFLVGSYRQVAEHLESQNFARALLKNGIQIYDHENRQIGASKPAMVEGQMRHTVFIYSAEKSRLIQSRASTRDQTR